MDENSASSRIEMRIPAKSISDTEVRIHREKKNSSEIPVEKQR